MKYLQDGERATTFSAVQMLRPLDDHVHGEDSMTEIPELEQTSRRIAALALDNRRQEGGLRVRQREQLRRALATAAATLGWDRIPGGPSARVAAVVDRMAQLAETGARALEEDLAAELTSKRAEIKELEKIVKVLRKLATDPDAGYPTEVEYSRTSRSGVGHLITKTETLGLNDPSEAEKAADTLERKRDGFARLRDEMLEELKRRKRQLGEMRAGLGDFSQASAGLVAEVLATLA